MNTFGEKKTIIVEPKPRAANETIGVDESGEKYLLIDGKRDTYDGEPYWLIEDGVRKAELKISDTIISKSPDLNDEFNYWMQEYIKTQNLPLFIKQKNYAAIIKMIKNGYEFSSDDIARIIQLSSIAEVKGETGKYKKIRTFLHELLDPTTGVAESKYCLTFLSRARDIIGNDRFAALAELSDGAQTAASLFKSKDLKRLLPAKPSKAVPSKAVVAVRSNIDTHTASVHSSVDISAQKLYDRLRERYLDIVPASTSTERGVVNISRTSKFKKFIDDKINEFSDKLDQWISLPDDHLKTRFAQANNKTVEAITADEITKFKYQLKAAQRYIKACKAGKISGMFTVDFNAPLTGGLTLKESTALIFDALRDDEHLVFTDKMDEGKKAQDRNSHFMRMVEHLFEIRREYNNNKYSGDDSWKCLGGTMNHLLDALVGVHDQVNVSIVNDADAIRRTKELFNEKLLEYINNLPLEKQLEFKQKVGKEVENNKMSIIDSYELTFVVADVVIQMQEELQDSIKYDGTIDKWITEGLSLAQDSHIIQECCALVRPELAAKEIYQAMQAKTLPLYVLTENGYVPFIESLSTDKQTKLKKYIISLGEAIDVNVLDNYDLLKEVSSFLTNEMMLKIRLSSTSLRFWRDKLAINNDLHVLDREGWTVLGRAAASGSLETVKLLLKMKPGLVNLTDSDGWTALYFAAANGHTEIAKLLIDKMMPEQLGMVDKNNGHTALHLAAQNGHTAIAKLLINKMTPGQLGMVDKNNGYTALHWAAEKGHTEIAQLLIEKMEQNDLALRDKKNGYTALHWAAEKGHTEIAQLLIEKMEQNDLALRDEKNGYTALHVAAINGYTEIARLLIEKMEQNDLALRDEKNGYTALHVAAINGYTEIARLLIAQMRPEQIAFTDSKCHTALYWAVKKGHTEIARLLINSKGFEFSRDLDYRTYTYDIESLSILYYRINILDIAICGNQRAMVELLVDKITQTRYDFDMGANRSFLNKKLKSKKLVDWVIRNKDYELIAIMLNNAMVGEVNDKKKHLVPLLNLFEEGVLAGKITNERAKKVVETLQNKISENNRYLPILIRFKPELARVMVDSASVEQLIKRDTDGRTALHYAVMNNQGEIVQKIINRLTPKEVAIEDNKGRSPLAIAVYNRFPYIVKLLTGKLSRDKEIKETLLKSYLTAAECGKTEVKDILKEQQNNMPKLNKEGREALERLMKEATPNLHQDIGKVKESIAPFEPKLPKFMRHKPIDYGAL